MQWLSMWSGLLIGSIVVTLLAVLGLSALYTRRLKRLSDAVEAFAEGGFTPAALQGTLADLCAGHCAGRNHADEITLFKAVGGALEDLAAAELVFDRLSRLPADA